MDEGNDSHNLQTTVSGNGEEYVGQATSLKHRVANHKLRNDWVKRVVAEHGDDDLQVEALAVVPREQGDRAEFDATIDSIRRVGKNNVNQRVVTFPRHRVNDVLRTLPADADYQTILQKLVLTSADHSPRKRRTYTTGQGYVYEITDAEGRVYVGRSTARVQPDTTTFVNINKKTLALFPGEYKITVHERGVYSELTSAVRRRVVTHYLTGDKLVNGRNGVVRLDYVDRLMKMIVDCNADVVLHELALGEKNAKKEYRIYLIHDKVTGCNYVGRTDDQLLGRMSLHQRQPQSKFFGRTDDQLTITTLRTCTTLEEARQAEYEETKRRLDAGEQLLNIRIGDKMTQAEHAALLEQGGGFQQGHATWNKGKAWSPEARAKMSAAAKGRPMSAQCLAASKAAHTGRKQRKSTVAKRAAALSKAVVCVETGKVYPSLTAVAEYMHTSVTAVARACANGRALVDHRGRELHWQRVDTKSQGKRRGAGKPVAVRCVTTGEEFTCAAHAARAYGLSTSALLRAARTGGELGQLPDGTRLTWTTM